MELHSRTHPAPATRPNPQLTDDERLVYEAVLRGGRRPGGSVILLDEYPDPQPATKIKRKKRA